MKHCSRLVLGVMSFLSLFTSVFAGPRDDAWKQVNDAIEQRLPKTAIDRLGPILTASLNEKAYPEAIKALGLKIALEGELQGNRPEEKIVRLQAELETVPGEMKPVLQAILAHWTWHYFQQNRWRFLQRTQTASAPGTDLQTWDLAQILAEVDRRFTAALADEALLKSTPIHSYDFLLEKGTVPDVYRPTLYDFIAYEALAFYQAGEQGAVKAEDAFVLEADSPIFDDVAAFIAWNPPSGDETSPAVKAIRLHQSLLQFHRSDRDRSAFYDADLARLNFGRNSAVGETKSERQQSALKRFAAATASHEVSARALAALARLVHEAGDSVSAHGLARRGRDAFPRSAGGALCRAVMQEIEAKSARVVTEGVWNAPWPTLDVTYRNVSRVYFRAVRLDFEAYLKRQRWGFGQIDHDLQGETLAAVPALSWSADLEPTRDFRERTQKTPAPKSLKPGYYVILSSHTTNFGDTDNLVSATLVWVSDLALLTRTNAGSEGDGGFVLNANTGAPVSGAKIRTWTSDREGRFLPSESTRTDDRGAFSLPGAGRRVLLLAEHNGHAVASDQLLNLGQVSRHEESRTSSVLFTDRALYRPGQSVHYKGISLKRGGTAGGYAVRAGVRQTVIFQDPNGQEITRATHVSNDYGSFSGVFVAPRDRLLGSMSLRLESGEGGVQVRVEEYKRPKFQVELAAPTEAAALDKAVALSGKATAYTGAAIGGATVSWRVERQSQLPLWCWWWRPTPSQAIARGKSVTAPDGTFPVTFTAAPDRAVPKKNEPIFVFTVHADVTDTTGETRSVSRTVSVGYAALQATLSAGEWQTPGKPVALTVATKSLEGEPLPAKGTVTVDALIQPAQVERKALSSERTWWGRPAGEPPVDPSNPDSWEPGRRVLSLPFTTGAEGSTQLVAPLPAGIYRASLVTRDNFGREVTTRMTIEVMDPAKRTYDVKVPNRVAAPTWSVEPGQTFTALWGTGYDQGRAFVELESDGKMLQRYWTSPDVTQSRIELPVTEAMRGGFSLSITYVRQNRSYVTQRVVEVPWSNKELSLTWERFRSKLEPGQPETWTAVVAGAGAKQRAAEMVATLYDASLDQFYPHSWPTAFTLFRREAPARWIAFHNQLRDFQYLRGEWNAPTESVDWSYRALPPELVSGVGIAGETVTLSAFQVSSAPVRGGRRAMAKMEQAMAPAAPAAADFAESAVDGQAPQQGTPPAVAPDLSQVTARKNLQETAFFFPHLLAGEDGRVRLQFTMPEALTQWKFLGFAHDRELRSGFLTDKAVTAKDLMVEPNPPRFVREGDAIEFTVKVSNQADTPQEGKVRLTFTDAATLASVDGALGNGSNEQAFTVPAKQSRTYSWRITVPDGQGFLTYKAVRATGKTSDGEEGMIPVLSRRIVVSESLPLPIRGPATREFEFKKLIESATSDTLRSQSLTVQMVSQPVWYAVMALPYLMEYPYECSEQVFNRLYANALARHVAQSDPKIRRIFDQWKGTPALDSPLEKNEALSSILLEETPWLRQAKSESQARRQVGLLFDGNRLDEETARLVRSLTERQLGGGLWPWFPGGPPSEYISLYLVAGFGRLRHLGVKMDLSAGMNALPALDAWMVERYRRIVDRDTYVPSSLDALSLYGRSFYLADRAVAPEHAEAVQYYLQQARRHWTKMESRQSQAHLALALKRWGDATTPAAILASLKERSVESAELGRFWNDRAPGWWWYHAPIETQAMMIEAFAEVTQDTQMVEDCKVWLLKQKQTQGWKTTKATADAVYALLLRGDSLLSSDARVEVSLAGETLQPEKVEAGTGFYEKTFVRDEVRPAMGQISVRKVDAGVSWGSVHWTYLEDIAKVTPHSDTPLRLKKTLFVAETTAKGRVLKPVTGAVAVGDELVVRLELRTDRDMEYVHLKDQRGSGTEPVEVLSRYRHQDGLSYYASTRDTASHFFIDYLPKGTYVFEYSTRVQLKGNYQSGIAEIQCMYAPEFNSHSESLTLQVD